MRCRACNAALSDRESSRKYVNWREITDPEERYIGLCDGCLKETDLFYPDSSDMDAEVDVDWVGEGA